MLNKTEIDKTICRILDFYAYEGRGKYCIFPSFCESCINEFRSKSVKGGFKIVVFFTIIYNMICIFMFKRHETVKNNLVHQNQLSG